jgi:hypothetical protein
MSQFSDLGEYTTAREIFYAKGAPRDPVAEAKEVGGTHYNAALGTKLMPTSQMSVGEHMGKIMSEVPRSYLAWVNAQPWAMIWHQWAPVAHYLTRHPVSDVDLLDVPEHVILISPGHRLCCAPGHEDKLHAFARGAMNLRRNRFQPRVKFHPPHYPLNNSQELNQAVLNGAHKLTAGTVTMFLREWETHLRHCTKHCYGSLHDAETEAAGQNQLNARRNGWQPLEAVYCELCELWHTQRISS